jgi:fido (protein-threonine AMPylation protein)
MSRYAESDPYLDPSTGVLKNKLGINDEATLAGAEADIVMARSYELEQSPIQGRFDLDHLRALHRHLFGSLYDWAGELRTVDLAKSGSMFAHHAYLETAGAQIFAQLTREQNLAGLGPDAFADRAAYFLGELNALHPFREGNGRVQRQFIGQLAQTNGYTIHWENVNQEQMLEASMASFHGDATRLARILRDNLTAD